MVYRKPLIPKPRKPRAKETKPRKPRLMKHERKAAFLDNFEAVIAKVCAGSTFAEAITQTPGAPCLSTFKKMASASTEHAKRMSAALKARERGINNRWGRCNRLDDASLDAILIAIQKEPTRHVNEICSEAGHSYNSLISRARRDRAFRIKLDKALAVRADARNEDGGPSFLSTGLMKNDLWRNANALLRLGDSDDADDIRMDAIVAMLESREVKQGQLMREHFRKVTSFGMKSLDEEVFSDGERILTRSDFVPASVEIADVHTW